MMPPKRLRVMMTTDAVGGVWVYAGELARALCESGNEVTLVVMGPPPRPHQLHSLRGTRGLHIEITDLALEWMDPEAADLVRARRVLMRIAEEFQPDLLHFNSFREAGFQWPAQVLVVAHSCVLSWWRACRGGAPGEPRWRTYADHVAAGLNGADAWVAPSVTFRAEISATYGTRMEGRVIRNGLTLPALATDKQPFLLAAGRFWDEGKNLAALSPIASELPWPVHVAGPLAAAQTCSPDADCRGVKFLGPISRLTLLDQMRRAAVFVSPALYEPFGLTVLEAALSGCALVLADLPSFREIWDAAALFVDPRDRSGLHKTLQKICDNRKLRRHLQITARTRARLYSRGAMVSAYQHLYAEMMPPPPVAIAACKDRVVELRA